MKPAVTLNEGEINLCRYMAYNRGRVNRKAGVRDRKGSGERGYDIDFRGYAGELAFCKIRNIYPDFSIHWQERKADRECDCIDPCYGPVDVKTIRSHGEIGMYVQAYTIKSHSPSYVAMQWDFPRMSCLGYATRDEIFTPDHQRMMGNGQTVYGVPRRELHDLAA